MTAGKQEAAVDAQPQHLTLNCCPVAVPLWQSPLSLRVMEERSEGGKVEGGTRREAKRTYRDGLLNAGGGGGGLDGARQTSYAWVYRAQHGKAKSRGHRPSGEA